MNNNYEYCSLIVLTRQWMLCTVSFFWPRGNKHERYHELSSPPGGYWSRYATFHSSTLNLETRTPFIFPSLPLPKKGGNDCSSGKKSRSNIHHEVRASTCPRVPNIEFTPQVSKKGKRPEPGTPGHLYGQKKRGTRGHFEGKNVYVLHDTKPNIHGTSKESSVQGNWRPTR